MAPGFRAGVVSGFSRVRSRARSARSAAETSLSWRSARSSWSRQSFSCRQAWTSPAVTSRRARSALSLCGRGPSSRVQMEVWTARVRPSARTLVVFSRRRSARCLRHAPERAGSFMPRSGATQCGSPSADPVTARSGSPRDGAVRRAGSGRGPSPAHDMPPKLHRYDSN